MRICDSCKTISLRCGVNGVGVVAAAAFAAVGLARRDYFAPAASAQSLTTFWSASSAVRTWALTLGLGISVLRRQGPSSELLAVAGLVQLGDSALGIRQRNLRMTVLPALMGLVHLSSARGLNRRAACKSAITA